MSDRSKPLQKSPFQSQRSTPQDPSTEVSLCVPIKQQKPTCSQSHTTISQNEKTNTPTRARWISTPTQSQRASAQNTPTNSLVCIPRDRPSAVSTPTHSLACIPKTSSRTLSVSTSQRTAKAASQFNPTATSTPRSSQMRQPWQNSPPTSGCGQRRALTSPGTTPKQGACLPCFPCPEPQNARPVSTPVERKACPFTMCKSVPQTDASVQGASSSCPEGGRRERILKLEILSVKGGTLYDRLPEYDPCYDVDPIVGIRPADSVTRQPKTNSGLEKVDGKFDGRPPLVVESKDRGSTFRADDGSSLTPDSKAEESPAAQQDLDDDDDIIRSAPVALPPFHLSEVSLTDMPPVKEEKEDETLTDSLHIGEPPSVDLGEAPFGDVSLPSYQSDLARLSPQPSHQSDIAGLSKQSETRQGNNSDAGVPVDGGVWVKEEGGGVSVKEGGGGVSVKEGGGGVSVKEEDGGGRVKEQDRGARVKEQDGGVRVKEQDGGSRVNVDKDSVPERGEEHGQTSTVHRTASELAMNELMTANGRGSFSLMLGPSVRNLARLVLSPLVALRTFIGPASSGRPVRPARRKQHGRYHDEPNPSGHARIRSIRSAFVVTPYGASASTFAFLLRRRTNRRITNRSVCSKDSSASSSEESQ